MKIETNIHGDFVLKEVYSGIALETSEGNILGVCMRDDTLELTVQPKGQRPKRFRINMQDVTIYEMKDMAVVSGAVPTTPQGGERR